MTDGTDPTTGTGQPWRDDGLPTEERVELLLDAMTREELIALALADFGALEHLGVPPLLYRDGPSGLRDVDGATAFPVALGLAATFDAQLAYEYGAAIGAELRAAGYNVLLGPAVDIARVPRGGRLAEAMGEDPWLAGYVGSAHVRGVQDQRVISMVKHLVANNFETLRTGDGPVQSRRDAVNVELDPRTLHEIYLAPIRRLLLDGAAWSVMGSYNRLNGTYACQNPSLYRIVKDDWDWPGFVAPDFMFAVRDPAAAAQAGLDIPGLEGSAGRTKRMFDDGAIPADRLADITRRIVRAVIGSGIFDTPVTGAAESPASPDHRALATRVARDAAVLLANPRGTLPLDRDRVRRLAVLGPAGADAVYIIGGSGGVEFAADQRVTPLEGITASAGESVVVRHAQGSLGDVRLPVIPAEFFTQAGGEPGLQAEYFHGRGFDDLAFARTEPTLDLVRRPDELDDDEWSARWTTRVTPTTSGRHRLSLTIGGEAALYVNGEQVAYGMREAVRFIVGPEYPLQATVELQAGVAVDLRVDYTVGPAITIEEFGLTPSAQLGWQPPDTRIAEAAQLAAASDVAVVIVQQAAGEGMDRQTLSLPGDQDELVRAVAAANANTVVVLNTPGPVLLPWLDDVGAVLQMWYPGQQFGAALGAVLFGDQEPGGRLPVTFPSSAEEIAASLTPSLASIDRTVRYAEGQLVGYRYFDANDIVPLFPFGHGLSYTSFVSAEPTCEITEQYVDIRLRVTNTGSRDGSTVVQLYTSAPGAVGHPPQQLKGAAKVRLPAGASSDVRLQVSVNDLVAYGVETNQFATADGSYEVRLAWSSRVAFWRREIRVVQQQFVVSPSDSD